LKGPRVELVPVGPEHRERLLALRNDPGVTRWWQEPGDDFLAEEADTFKYVVLLEDEPIGFVQWYEETDPMYRHAGVDLFLGDAFQGCGLGTEVVRVACTHLIDDRGFHRLVIDPEIANEAAIACYRKVGFKPVGVMRRYEQGPDETWHDGLLMDLLAEELSPS
jgi:aminoglycoside 6'-N-acetyltransferase